MFAPDLSTAETELKYMNQEQNKGNVLKNTKVNSDENIRRPEPAQDRLNELFTKLNLSGIQDWPEDLQQKVHNLMVEYQHLFTLNDLELGKTSMVKYKIKLSNQVPFKEDTGTFPCINLMKSAVIYRTC